MKRVLSVSSSRADVSILAPVWSALTDYDNVDLHIFLTGMHQAAGAPAVEGLPTSATVHAGGSDLGGAAGGEAAAAMAAITKAAGQIYADTEPDLVLVMGDRLDMLPAAVASLPFNLPMAHLHGGEITEGAIDDRVRHSLSKLATLHCVSSEGAKAQLLAIDVAEDAIVVTGAPGLDTLKAAPTLTREEFLAETELDTIEGDPAHLRLVTVHPETNSDDPLAPLTAVMAALDTRAHPTLFTAPNSDPGGAKMRRRIEKFVAERPWARFVDTLGLRLYANALRHAAVMIGNSSSGIIEAGLFGLPVIDVGDRQRGRERGENVVSVANDTADLVYAAAQFRARPGCRFAAHSPYGAGTAGPKVAAAILANPGDGRRASVKQPRIDS